MLRAFFLAFCAFAFAGASAQERYPAKPLRAIVPFAPGGSTHLSAELFKSMAGMDVVHIPFKGSGQALIDVVAGRVSMIFDNMPSALPHIRGGKLRALGVTGSKRSAALPEVPTIAEHARREREKWGRLVRERNIVVN